MNDQTQHTKPMTIVHSGLRRPNWVCKNVKQNVVLVRDRSSSMHGRKAQDASAASLELVAELAAPSSKEGFNIAVVDFATSSGVAHDLGPATVLNGKLSSLSVGLLGGSTNITAALEDATSILENSHQQQEGIAYLRPVVLMFTDGCHNGDVHPRDVATRLKQTADLVCIAFGNDADEALLRELASTPQHFYRCSSGRELRAFLAAVGATLTATMAAGSNATRALTTIQQ